MAHNLTIRTDGTVEMFSAGTRPVWHRLGQRTPEAITSEQAIKLAHLDWTVAEKPIQLTQPIRDNTSIASHKAIIREDNGNLLGVVGHRYTPIQNVEAFQWLDSVVGEKRAIYETAGSIHGGRFVWMMIRLPEDLRVKGTDDLTTPYVLVCNSHDGTRPLRILDCAVRVVCNNTLTLALARGNQQGLNIRHTACIREKVDEARKALGIAVRRYGTMQQEMDRLAQHQMSVREVKAYFLDVWPDHPQVENTSRTQAVRDQLMENFESERLAGVRGSAWAAFNAVTAYTDWQRPTRGRTEGHRDNNRLASIWFGDSATVKRKAWDKALELVAN